VYTEYLVQQFLVSADVDVEEVFQIEKPARGLQIVMWKRSSFQQLETLSWIVISESACSLWDEDYNVAVWRCYEVGCVVGDIWGRMQK
jgi:hypothetical protein